MWQCIIIFIVYCIFIVKDVDQIVVFDEGKIVECGWYDELLVCQGIYVDMY